MNVTVGKITPRARGIIEAAHGTIRKTETPGVFVVSIPDATMEDMFSNRSKILIGEETLIFHRPSVFETWSEKDCALDIPRPDLDFNAYQQEALRTSATRGNDRESRIAGALGLAGEAGEVVDILKKNIIHGHDIDLSALEKELGDVMWYIAILAASVGMTLQDVVDTNVEKLRKRYPDGFESARSINREEK